MDTKGPWFGHQTWNLQNYDPSCRRLVAAFDYKPTRTWLQERSRQLVVSVTVRLVLVEKVELDVIDVEIEEVVDKEVVVDSFIAGGFPDISY